MLTSREIRQQFIDYFAQKHGHTFVPSSPVVPHGDPTLLFTNAGMNQFKDVFLGTGTRPYTRAANTQKCIRAGGKHNDLEDVGKDTYHHTFFEMLGNWSFGDYFKAEAIGWAWDLLTNVWGLPKDRLYATVFGGDASDGLAADTEAEELWKKHTDIDPSHITRWDREDNFWEMGETGPCGPCSEIHIDLTPDGSGGHLVNKGDPTVIEIWNLVFIQFNRTQSGKLEPLPARHVDTGMGFERLCCVLQNKKSNYDTDVWTPLFEAISNVTGARPYQGRMTQDHEGHIDTAYRVIADHVRCLTFALTDGAVPSNDGRGYVLRRILRRAVRHGWQTLGLHQPFLHRLVPAVVDAMGDAFPELKARPDKVATLIHEEEQSFAATLDRGIALFEDAAARGGQTIRGEDAFKLHDTYGFPLDLTQVMAEERGLAVDVAGFNERMDQAREMARGGGRGHDISATLLEIVQREKPGATAFVGYEQTSLRTGEKLAIFRLTDGGYLPAEQAVAGDYLAIVAAQTPFYAESGGQVGDVGMISSAAAGQFAVHDTQKIGDVYFHLGKVVSPIFKPGSDELTLQVDEQRREKIAMNHTVTHMMNHKLRAVLGGDVQQKGSLVDDEKTRFDFSHGSALTTEEIQEVERLVNADIERDLPVYYGYAPQEEALKVHGLRAVFGEKYPPVVRMVTIGAEPEAMLADPSNRQWGQMSVEFCGGTHLKHTGAVKRFVITSEEAVAKGVRRITAVTGASAARASEHAGSLEEQLRALTSAAGDVLVTGAGRLADAIGASPLPSAARSRLRDLLAEAQKRVKDYQKQQAKAATGDAVDAARQIAEQATGNLIVSRVEGADGNTLRAAMDVIRQKRPEAALLLAAVADGKVAIVASVPQTYIDRGLKAGDWVREVAKATGGGGGGRPDMAQAGGKDPAKLDAALTLGRQYAEGRMG